MRRDVCVTGVSNESSPVPHRELPAARFQAAPADLDADPRRPRRGGRQHGRRASARARPGARASKGLHGPHVRDGGFVDALRHIGDDALRRYLTVDAPAAIVAGEPLPPKPS